MGQNQVTLIERCPEGPLFGGIITLIYGAEPSVLHREMSFIQRFLFLRLHCITFVNLKDLLVYRGKEREGEREEGERERERGEKERERYSRHFHSLFDLGLVHEERVEKCHVV